MNDKAREFKELDDKVYELIEKALDKERAAQALDYYLYDKGSVLSLLEFGISESIRKDDLEIYYTFQKAFEHECYAKHSECFGFTTFCVFSGLHTSFFKIEQPARNGAKHLYVILLSNGSVKIGIAHDTNRRYSQIKASSGMKIEKHWESDLIENAFVLETKLHNKYKAFRLNGEYFNIDYEDAVQQAKQIAMIEG